MSPQLPIELFDNIAQFLRLDELWRIRNVNFRWNQIALQRAWSLLYVDSQISLVSAQFPYGAYDNVVALIATIQFPRSLTMKSRQTSGKPYTDLLTWYCEDPDMLLRLRQMVATSEQCCFYINGISLPQTVFKWIYLT